MIVTIKDNDNDDDGDDDDDDDIDNHNNSKNTTTTDDDEEEDDDDDEDDDVDVDDDDDDVDEDNDDYNCCNNYSDEMRNTFILPLDHCSASWQTRTRWRGNEMSTQMHLALEKLTQRNSDTGKSRGANDGAVFNFNVVMIPFTWSSYADLIINRWKKVVLTSKLRL